MTLTRLDSPVLHSGVQSAKGNVDDARTTLEPLLVTKLTTEQRQAIARAPARLAEAARILADAAEQWPELAKAAEFDSAAVLEDLANVAILAGLAERCREIARWADDSQLVWLGEAYQQCLALYDIAKARQSRDGSIRTLIEPIAEIFANRKKPEEQTPAESP